MSEAQRVGQLFMVGTSSTHADADTIAAITQSYVGSVILDGNSSLSVQRTLGVVNALQAQVPTPPRLFVSTDQEGGLVQRLKGPGFPTMPSGLQQGKLDPTTLMNDATDWGHPLKAAGVNVNLAPVADTVPSASAANNPPIGDLDRQFGSDPASVAAHTAAVVKGYQSAAIASTIKHFPGLGRVTGNTDTTTGVTDSVTTRTDPYLAPFSAGIAAGVPFVMMSTAVYSQLDPGVPAVFSKPIVTDMLRNDLKFTGIVITDDVGAAKQVASIPVGDRATRFIAAGGTMVLTVDPSIARQMAAAVLTRAASDPAFKAQVDAAALLVLQTKQRYGLI